MLHNDERPADILPSWPAETVLPSPLTIDSLALEVEPFTLESEMQGFCDANEALDIRSGSLSRDVIQSEANKAP